MPRSPDNATIIGKLRLFCYLQNLPESRPIDYLHLRAVFDMRKQAANNFVQDNANGFYTRGLILENVMIISVLANLSIPRKSKKVPVKCPKNDQICTENSKYSLKIQ